MDRPVLYWRFSPHLADSISANLVANRTVRELRNDLFQKLGKLPIPYFDAIPRGDILSRFSNDIDAISDGLNQGIVQLVSGVSRVFFSLGFSWR